MNIRIEHVALWCRDLEAMRNYYCDCFGAVSGELYHNPNTGFSSYFLSFPGGGTRLELMHKPEEAARMKDAGTPGHFSFQVGTEQGVHEMAARIDGLGGTLVRGPRRTGDGYYELETLDPEGNLIEVIA